MLVWFKNVQGLKLEDAGLGERVGRSEVERKSESEVRMGGSRSGPAYSTLVSDT